MTHRWKRFYEILPGAMVWTTLIFSVVCSFVRPLWMVYFVILFDLYWLLRVLYFLPFLLMSWYRFRRDIKRDWQNDAERLPGYDGIYHLIFLPTVKEELSVVRETLRVLASCAYPASRMIVVLAGEGRVSEHFRGIVAQVEPEFRGKFFAFFTTEHPINLPDEIIGKGSNLNWAGHQVVPKLLELGLDPDRVIVSSFDVDTIVHQQYFS